MPLFRFRLEDPDSDFYRAGTCEFDTKEEAKAELVRREEERCVPYQAENIAELEQAEKDKGWDNMSGRERAALHTHRQTKPYKLVSLKEVS